MFELPLILNRNGRVEILVSVDHAPRLQKLLADAGVGSQRLDGENGLDDPFRDSPTQVVMLYLPREISKLELRRLLLEHKNQAATPSPPPTPPSGS